MKKTKKVKAWCLVWSEKGFRQFGMRKTEIIGGDIASSEYRKLGVVEPKTKWVTYLAFKGKMEAVRFKDKNDDFDVIPCTITYTP